MNKLDEMTFELAEKLAKETDYACEASHTDINPINWGDAAAFFLEGYQYAQEHTKDCYPREFVEWIGLEGVELRYYDEIPIWIHYKRNTIEPLVKFNTIDELFTYWKGI